MTMAAMLWLFVLLLAFLALMFINPRFRKQVLIVTTYMSLTGWYYYRQWEKAHGGPKAASSKRLQHESESDVVYFESAQNVRKASEVPEELGSQRSQSEASHRLSETSSSGQSEDPTGKRRSSKGLGIFRKLRKSHRDDASDVHSNSLVSDVSSTSSASVATGISTRRMFSGRKKPASWGE